MTSERQLYEDVRALESKVYKLEGERYIRVMRRSTFMSSVPVDIDAHVFLLELDAKVNLILDHLGLTYMPKRQVGPELQVKEKPES